MAHVCTVKIFGRVFGRRDDGEQAPVPFGVYNMEELSPGVYRLSGNQRPESYEPTLNDVSLLHGLQDERRHRSLALKRFPSTPSTIPEARRTPGQSIPGLLLRDPAPRARVHRLESRSAASRVARRASLTASFDTRDFARTSGSQPPLEECLSRSL